MKLFSRTTLPLCDMSRQTTQSLSLQRTEPREKKAGHLATTVAGEVRRVLGKLLGAWPRLGLRLRCCVRGTISSVFFAACCLCVRSSVSRLLGGTASLWNVYMCKRVIVENVCTFRCPVCLWDRGPSSLRCQKILIYGSHVEECKEKGNN